LFSFAVPPRQIFKPAPDRSFDRFTGKPVSATTGLYYDFQRWYDPSVGRFINQDPLPGYASDPQSLNPYVYVENTPTSLVDPTGAYDEYSYQRESLDQPFYR